MSEEDYTLLKKKEVLRDEMGRFEQHGTGLIKKTQSIKRKPDGKYEHGGARPGAGRPLGSKNKVPLALKEMILQSLDELGGVEYLKKLAIENSSAYASILSKVLPSTLQASNSDGGPAKITFERVIVWPDGRREIEGKTPKQLPPPNGDKDQ